MSRTVVVSGGGSGIGRATARWFAARGDSVWVVGRRAAALEQTVAGPGSGGRAVVADLSTPEGAQAVADALDGATVDVVVAGAGGTAAQTPSVLTDVAAAWHEDISANLMTAVLLVAALRNQLARPGGRVIGISSIGAQLGSGYGGSYGAAKAALHAWSYWLAAELGPDEITVNLVLPGYVADTEFFGERMTADFHQVRVDRTLVNRAGTPQDVAAVIGFLASPEAGFVTGQLIGVSGGTVLGR